MAPPACKATKPQVDKAREVWGEKEDFFLPFSLIIFPCASTKDQCQRQYLSQMDTFL